MSKRVWKKKIFHRCMSLVSYGILALLRLRYRIQVRGLKELKKSLSNRDKGILFLPSHPAEIDPVLMMSLLWKDFASRPLVVDHFYYQKNLYPLMQLVSALSIPNVDSGLNSWKEMRIEKLLESFKEGIGEKENFLIYPSGRLKLSGEERLQGASLVQTLLEEIPGVHVVLVRISGLWGSRFSRALGSKLPDFFSVLWEGVKTVLVNGIFFTPRRKVEIEFAIPEDFPYRGSRVELTRFLEKWYNAPFEGGVEPLKLVSFRFWKKMLPEVEKKSEKEDSFTLDPKLEKEVLQEIEKIAHCTLKDLSYEKDLSRDLGMDSLDIAQLGAFLRHYSYVDETVLTHLRTVGDVLKTAAGKGEKPQETVPEKKLPKEWQEKKRPVPKLPQGKSIGEAFLLSCNRMGNAIACADRKVGLLRYPQLKRAAFALARYMETLPGEKIGVLLPSSSGAYLVILACILAKKIPVMLNWTAGVRSLDHAMEVTGLERVVSSYQFLDRIPVSDLGKISERIALLEEIRFTMSWKLKLQSLVRRKSAYLGVQEEDTAVILFTSGTESLPKGVPLTHKNLLSNQRGALSCIGLQPDDTVYGVLPPFHSFGFSVTGLMPLLAGLKVFYAPDPTASAALAQDIEESQATLFCCAPPFMKNLLQVAEKNQLQSVRYFVSGAEKAPKDLLEKIQQLGKGHYFLEGYGITECAPIVTIQRLGETGKGVGTPLPEVSLRVIDPETNSVLPQGKEGEICIQGPNVFPGYLSLSTSPFIELEGKKWYRSGDRGYLDSEGTLMLTGRSKRFVKIGGEMISLGGLEEEILQLTKEKKWSSLQQGVSLAISVKEGEKPTLILFTTFSLEKEKVNAALQEKGYSRLVKITAVRKIGEIPLTGTGKTNYRALDELE